MSEPIGSIRIPEWFQGPTGTGNGGWSAAEFSKVVGESASYAIRAPVPLDTELEVTKHDTGWQVTNTTGPEPVVILEAEPWKPSVASTTPVSIEEAIAARGRFAMSGELHPVPFCFSCGVQHDSMNVHAGPLGDGRYATDWTVPQWATAGDGTVNRGAVWAALDCASAWYVCCEPSFTYAFTVQYAVEIVEPILPGGTYAIVAWSGDAEPGWQGRKRQATSAAFDDAGVCVAKADSLWVSVASPNAHGGNEA